MSVSSIARPWMHAALQTPGDPRVLTMEEVVPYLVGHTVEEVERELILHTLDHYKGSRTQSARVLGISIRCIRNKIHEYESLGITALTPRAPGRH
jgi:DNA-binding NtrC family response regulator